VAMATTYPPFHLRESRRGVSPLLGEDVDIPDEAQKRREESERERERERDLFPVDDDDFARAFPT